MSLTVSAISETEILQILFFIDIVLPANHSADIFLRCVPDKNHATGLSLHAGDGASGECNERARREAHHDSLHGPDMINILEQMPQECGQYSIPDPEFSDIMFSFRKEFR